MPKTRNQYLADQKVAILRRHLIDRTSIAELCDEYKIHPTMFYQWQAQLFENGSHAFARKTNSAVTQHQKNIEQLEAKLQRKNEVVGRRGHSKLICRRGPFWRGLFTK